MDHETALLALLNNRDAAETIVAYLDLADLAELRCVCALARDAVSSHTYRHGAVIHFAPGNVDFVRWRKCFPMASGLSIVGQLGDGDLSALGGIIRHARLLHSSEDPSKQLTDVGLRALSGSVESLEFSFGFTPIAVSQETLEAVGKSLKRLQLDCRRPIWTNFSSFTLLHTLRIRGDAVTPAMLQQLPSLRHLDIVDSPLSAECFAHLDKLETFKARRGVRATNWIPHLKAVRTLRIDARVHQPIGYNPDHLEGCPDLTHLSVKGSKFGLTDAGIKAVGSRVKTLKMVDQPAVTDVAFAHLPQVETLIIKGGFRYGPPAFWPPRERQEIPTCPISGCNFFKMARLKHAVLWNLPLLNDEALHPISKNLASLNLRNCALVTASAIQAMEGLQELTVWDAGLVSDEIVAALPALRTLKVRTCKAADGATDALTTIAMEKLGFQRLPIPQVQSHQQLEVWTRQPLR